MYPTQLDCVWLASDSSGALAAFITAGEGPIPIEVLSRCDVTSLEREILRSLPAFTQATVLVSVPKPDSYRELAERGLFVYDWTDLHRVRADETRAYELVARPQQSLQIDSLPGDLHDLVMALPVGSFEKFMKVVGANPER